MVISMLCALENLSCVCALGRTNDEVLAGLQARSTAGMVPLSSDIPGRTVLFGAVRGELPEIADDEYNTRTNRLVKLAVENKRAEFESFVARYGTNRVAVVLGTSNTGIDEAERHVDAWLNSGAKPSAMRFSEIELGTPSEYLAKLLGVTGPAYSISTACSSSAKVFPAARRLILNGFHSVSTAEKHRKKSV